jgi:hypothetical protein
MDQKTDLNAGKMSESNLSALFFTSATGFRIAGLISQGWTCCARLVLLDRRTETGALDETHLVMPICVVFELAI